MTNDAPEQLRTEFNEWARAGKGESMERGHRPVGEQAIERMRVPTDARVLDVGCGSGWASRLLAGFAIKGSVTGIDISDEMINLARESSRAFPQCDFEVASAEQLPFSDNEFTHAFSMESLYYYRDIDVVLAKGKLHNNLVSFQRFTNFGALSRKSRKPLTSRKSPQEVRNAVGVLVHQVYGLFYLSRYAWRSNWSKLVPGGLVLPQA